MKKNKNKVLTYLLMLALVLSLASCKGKDKEADNAGVSAAPTTTADENKELTSLELVKLMGNGINLGNTMEAYGYKDLGTTAEISEYETLWGMPETTKEIIQGMKDAGFDSLRIPVAWTNGMNFESGDYTIRKELLDRVEEIVNYALDADMYVIVNDHWDGGWWGMFGSAKQETRDKAMEHYISMWTQIGNRFKDYSDKLIFESANEELGSRLNDKDADFNKDSGTLSEDECYQTTNRINQTFVDTIRGIGGNNAERFLLIAGYNTDIEKTCDDRFVMPTDTADSKLLLSVHYYTPWGYCGTDSLSRWGSEKNYNEQNELLAMMKKFTDKGYGIVIGEYAVLPIKDGSIKENVVEFYTNFLNNCDMYDYVPMLWDCNYYYQREEKAINDQGVADLFNNRSLAAQSSKTDEQIVKEATTGIEDALAAVAAKMDDVEKPDPSTADKAIAWIMFNSSDWSVMYSVGDSYDPDGKTDGLVATDVEVTGAGTYTVGIDFTGTGLGYADSTAFSALAIGNGEIHYPGYIVTIKEIKIDGEPYTLMGKPYTTSDDEKCTRVNLYNEWVSAIPEEARTSDGKTSDASAKLLDKATLGQMKTLEITFDYGPAE